MFWEHLGRAVATFWYLEYVLTRAIFAFTATRRYPEVEIQAAFDKWLPTLERALRDPLGNLIDSYAKAVRDHPSTTPPNFDELLLQLREASTLRNVLCHACWNAPGSDGRSLPIFVNNRMMVFDTVIDTAYLTQTQRGTAELSCDVITSVTHLGWRFPGFDGPRKPVY
ncbi:MAG: hypothetical protein WDN02_02800 [Methylovirgula sp.]|uniref:hypothetical protein n=1 Tax=Methylovirgula sp. TaxID=1978224 RepID=UPI0030763982